MNSGILVTQVTERGITQGVCYLGYPTLAAKLAKVCVVQNDGSMTGRTFAKFRHEPSRRSLTLRMFFSCVAVPLDVGWIRGSHADQHKFVLHLCPTRRK